ncbi:Lrp/AsnC family transcriptional regulator [Sphingomonas corticis]|jgi:DNA-binding Lrp family transcriptional regulator|uniref:Lrp/AsnC family transcriptional regulator n=1 Tax=Sphingomonas corticis TaxID=2722791 RepID=A0ABX1CNZ9_9SPHN|nr:Lrp/AsnC family transcriptional regulator [Sphingomonas corticis]NJR77795.1 Lrp/AsnC family transcriptional regulator [Sphingomonas corticis]
MPEKRELDGHDRALLRLLQVDAARTADDLAQEVPLSPSAITRRVRRLHEDGTIVADVAIVSDRVAPFLSALVDVQLDRHALAEVDAVLRRLCAAPEVQALMEVTGPSDLALLVVVADMHAFNAFADAMLGSDPVVRRYETRFVKKRRKFTTALPL